VIYGAIVLRSGCNGASLRCRPRFAACLLLIAVAASPANAANEVDYQVAWRLGPVERVGLSQWVKRNETIYSVSLVPERLFQTTEAVRSADGMLLLNSGMQLVGMDSRTAMVCSLFRGLSPSLAEANRICLIDGDRDGRFESFLTKGFKPGLYGGEGQLFGLAGKFAEVRPMPPITLTVIESNAFTNSPKMKVVYKTISDGNRNTLIYTHLGSLITLPNECPTFISDGAGDLAVGQVCRMPGATVRAVERTGKDLRFEIVEDRNKPRIRFRYISGMFDYRTIGFSLLD
jgi:hypothetical protein